MNNVLTRPKIGAVKWNTPAATRQSGTMNPWANWNQIDTMRSRPTPDKSPRAEPALPPAFAKRTQTNGLAADLKREANKKVLRQDSGPSKAQHTGRN
jgi:hypothetical protein